MAWEKIVSDERIKYRESVDVVVKLKHMYFPVRSKLREYMEEEGLNEYDVYVDRKSGSIAICPCRDGTYRERQVQTCAEVTYA
jgi:hypothetical protein